jgi:hypothetical protein
MLSEVIGVVRWHLPVSPKAMPTHNLKQEELIVASGRREERVRGRETTENGGKPSF